ncbi:MAG TPA: hypothetical protein VMD74_02790, partial [Candidatus Methylomirabilis sp.]|nr:hypothetical protein [Candidatus Methylomirabilis sp.]
PVLSVDRCIPPCSFIAVKQAAKQTLFYIVSRIKCGLEGLALRILLESSSVESPLLDSAKL